MTWAPLLEGGGGGGGGGGALAGGAAGLAGVAVGVLAGVGFGVGFGEGLGVAEGDGVDVWLVDVDPAADGALVDPLLPIQCFSVATYARALGAANRKANDKTRPGCAASPLNHDDMTPHLSAADRDEGNCFFDERRGSFLAVRRVSRFTLLRATP